MLTHFVFRVLQIEHEGPVFVFVFAVGAKTEVKHLLFNSKCQSPHLALCHFQIITVAHPGGNEQKNVCLNLQTSGNVFGTKRRKNLEKKKKNQTGTCRSLTFYKGCLSKTAGCSVSSGC